MSKRARAVMMAAAALVVTLPAAGTPAFAVGHSGGATSAYSSAYDISYPQCDGPFPRRALLGVVGVNGGRVYSSNPCLGTEDGRSELAWADTTGNPQFYANTADPGPAYSSYWDLAAWDDQPQTCSSAATNSTGCSYDYGWYAAQDSFLRAVRAEQQVYPFLDDPVSAVAGARWWLDVETGNSWESLESRYSSDPTTALANDTAALQGAVGSLAHQGVTRIGFYSTGYQWDRITGGTGTRLAAYPVWIAGFSSATRAAAGCTTATSFTGGPVLLTQYQVRGFDADQVC